MITYLLFIVGFYVLVKGAELLIKGSVSVAKKFNVPSIVIGLTIVAFGTSLPEFVVSFIAGLKGNSGIAIGNVLGSNIVNIFFILGISSIIRDIKSGKETVCKQIPFSFFVIFLTGSLLSINSVLGIKFYGLTRFNGAIMLFFFFLYMLYTIKLSKSMELKEYAEEKKQENVLNAVILIIIGLTGLILGGEWIVRGAVKIAAMFNIDQTVIGLTIVAIGTSLPELATSVVAVCKKEDDIAIGNIIGSNIFNVLWILGFTSLICPIPFNKSLNFDIFMTAFASLLLFVFMYSGKKYTLKRWHGITMIFIYICYIYYLIIK